METVERGSEETFKITDLIMYEYDSEGVRRPTGINIFLLCKALLEGHAEKLSEKVLLRDGPVHIFDVCLQHDLWSIACEMASRGVEGCELQMRHLDPFGGPPSTYGSCRCTDSNECKYCCWGFPVHQGTCMTDFDVEVWRAHEAARKAVGRTWIGQCLRLASSVEKLPFAVSDGAMARLLDIAILTGNQKAAQGLATKCKVLPLRRWRSVDFIYYGRICLPDVLTAALSAGVHLWDLWARECDPKFPEWWEKAVTGTRIPFREAVFLLSSSTWKQCADIMPQPSQQRQEPWKPDDGNNLAPYFIDNCQIDLEKIRLGMEAGLDLKCIEGHGEESFLGKSVRYTLLDLCILNGQIQAARSVAGQLKQVERIKQALSHPSNQNISFSRRVDRHYETVFIAVASPSSCLLAAGAAAKAALIASLKHHARVISQTDRSAFIVNHIPASAMILAFSVEAPTWIEELNLWKEVDGWSETIPSTRPTTQFQNSGADSGGATVTNEEAGSEPQVSQEPGTMETQDISTIDRKSTDELLMALQASRDEVPALNIDGVCIFRLTRRAKCTEVNDVLLDATGPLASLHKRVLDAGCQVNPEGNLVKALFVPCTEQQLVELQGYELCKDEHLLALQDDGPVIDRALRSRISNKDRPRLQKLRPRSMVPPGDSPAPESHQAARSSTDAAPDPDADNDDEDDTNEPLLVLECGFRTDSSLAYPSYQVQ